MEVSVTWSDLLMEQGKLDPLGLWRVGDRMSGELLKPFTTVVMSRPARYFSMYAWMIGILLDKEINDKKVFWRRFYEMESILLCAIQLHSPHNYGKFSGQIGSEQATKMMAEAGATGILKAEKIKNGWEANYKMPMFEFGLFEDDFSSPINIRLTERGRLLAEAYHNVVKETVFCKEHLDSIMVPVMVVQELAMRSCPCLIYGAESGYLADERVVIVRNTLSRGLQSRNEEEEMILSSIHLVLDCMDAIGRRGVAFEKVVMHRALSCGAYETGREQYKYEPLPIHLKVYAKWRMYTLDLLFVYALESGLCGFLEELETRGGGLPLKQLLAFAADVYEKGQVDADSTDFLTKAQLGASLNSAIIYFQRLSPFALYDHERRIVENIQESTGWKRLFWSFILYVHAQALFLRYKDVDSESKVALEFYRDAAMRDGDELSLIQTSELLSFFGGKQAYDVFARDFLETWIVSRQLGTRRSRQKDVAWFSRNEETGTFEFEQGHKPGIYRASRISVLMSYLLNVEIVLPRGNGWVRKDTGLLLSEVS